MNEPTDLRELVELMVSTEKAIADLNQELELKKAKLMFYNNVYKNWEKPYKSNYITYKHQGQHWYITRLDFSEEDDSKLISVGSSTHPVEALNIHNIEIIAIILNSLENIKKLTIISDKTIQKRLKRWGKDND